MDSRESDKEKGDDVSMIVNMSEVTSISDLQKSNEFPKTLENNPQGISLAVADEYIQESVQNLLGCEEGDTSLNQYSSSISLVPSILRDHSPKSFNPFVVSIGPVHHENENLKGSEGWKRTCMNDLLRRSPSHPEETLAACLRKVNESIQKIRTCYVGISSYSDQELVRMMVIDGCFILEVLFPKKKLNDLLREQIFRDLLLVENQIPFFILKYIFECTILKSEPSVSLNKHIKRLLKFGHRCFFKDKIEILDVVAHASDGDHILSLLHKCYQPKSKLSSGPLSLICNVIQLEKAGVNFKPNQDVSWPLEIQIEWSRFPCLWFCRFWDKPTLKIPRMTLEDNTEMFLRNIIAYEQTSGVVGYLTSYLSAINDLVDNGNDIARLLESKIIITGLGSTEEVAELFNTIGKNVLVENFYIKQWKALEKYYNGYWPRNIARLRRTYFNSPWNIIALIAGIILFVLTMTQTYFTVNPIK